MKINKLTVTLAFLGSLFFCSAKEALAKDTFITVFPFDSNITDFDAGYAVSDTISYSLGNTKGKIFNDYTQINTLQKNYRKLKLTINNSKMSKLLDSDFYLQGNIDFSKNTYTANIDIYTTANDKLLHTMKLEEQNYFNLQEKIVTDLAKYFKINITEKNNQKRLKLIVKPTNDLISYKNYVLGRKNYFLQTTSSLQKSIINFDKAFEQDKKFDLAQIMKIKADSILTLQAEEYFYNKKLHWDYSSYKNENYYYYLSQSAQVSFGSGYNWHSEEESNLFYKKVENYKKIVNKLNYLETGYQALTAFYFIPYKAVEELKNNKEDIKMNEFLSKSLSINPNDSLSFIMKAYIEREQVKSDDNKIEDEYGYSTGFEKFNNKDYERAYELSPLNFLNYELVANNDFMSGFRKKMKYNSQLSLALNDDYLAPHFLLSQSYLLELNKKELDKQKEKVLSITDYYYVDFEGKKWEEKNKFDLDTFDFSSDENNSVQNNYIKEKDYDFYFFVFENKKFLRFLDFKTFSRLVDHYVPLILPNHNIINNPKEKARFKKFLDNELKRLEPLEKKFNSLEKAYSELEEEYNKKNYTNLEISLKNIIEEIYITEKGLKNYLINKIEYKSKYYTILYKLYYQLAVINFKNNNIEASMVNMGKSLDIFDNQDNNEKNDFKEKIETDIKYIALNYKKIGKNLTSEEYFYIANVFYSVEDYQNAINAYIELEKLEPKNAVTKKLLGICYFKLNELDKAETILLKSIELEPFDNDILVTLAYTYNKSKKYKEFEGIMSKKFINFTYDNETKNMSFKINYLNNVENEDLIISFAEVLYNLGKKQESLAIYKSYASNSLENKMKVDLISSELGISSKEEFNSDVESNYLSSIDKVKLKSVFNYFKSKNKENSIKIITRKLFTPSINNILSANSIKGLNYYFDEKIKEAKENFEKALLLNNDDYDTYNNLAIINIMENKLDLALANFQKSLEKNPKNDVAILNLGILYDLMQEKEKAQDKYKKVCDDGVFEGCVLQE